MSGNFLPEVNSVGNLNGFNVQGGEITIEGDDLDGTLQDATSIYTHFLNLNAKLIMFYGMSKMYLI